jgi:hypothetical protein
MGPFFLTFGAPRRIEGFNFLLPSNSPPWRISLDFYSFFFFTLILAEKERRFNPLVETRG